MKNLLVAIALLLAGCATSNPSEQSDSRLTCPSLEMGKYKFATLGVAFKRLGNTTESEGTFELLNKVEQRYEALGCDYEIYAPTLNKHWIRSIQEANKQYENIQALSD